MGKTYPVAVSFNRNQQLAGTGYVATVKGGHHKVKHLFAFGDNRKEAGTALAKVVYETPARSLRHVRSRRDRPDRNARSSPGRA